MEGRVCLVDRWSFEVPKTKEAAGSLRALGVDGNVLVVISGQDVVAERSFGNLPNVNIVEAGQLTAYDVVVSDWVVFTDETVPGQVSDAPEGSVVLNSSRPVALEVVERPARPTGPPRSKRTADRRPTRPRTLARPPRPTMRKRTSERRPFDPVAPRHLEKSYALMDEHTYVFVVDPRASKVEIRAAGKMLSGYASPA